MFFFNWNSPKKNAQADDSGNSNSFPTMSSNQPSGQPASQSVNQFTNNQSSTIQSNPTPTAAFPKQDNPYGDMFNDASRFGGPSKSEDSVTPTGHVPAEDYVDAYVPPQHLRHTPWTDSDEPTESAKDAWSGTPDPVAAAPVSPKDATVSVKADSKPDFYFDSTTASDSSRFKSDAAIPANPQSKPKFSLVDMAADNPIFKQAAPKAQTQEPARAESEDQTLEAQNIFHLLGVEDGNDQEKESFLDELQQVVWEDFVENDVALLLTESEYTEFKKIIDKKDVSNEDMQEEALVYLEKLVPDLEEILLEKAMELKRDMVMERIMGMKEFYANNPEFLQVISQVESLLARDMWKDGADMLNTLK